MEAPTAGDNLFTWRLKLHKFDDSCPGDCCNIVVVEKLHGGGGHACMAEGNERRPKSLPPSKIDADSNGAQMACAYAMSTAPNQCIDGCADGKRLNLQSNSDLLKLTWQGKQGPDQHNYCIGSSLMNVTFVIPQAASD